MLGLLLLMFSTTMLPPAGVGFWYADETNAFIESFIITFDLGLFIWWPLRREQTELEHRDGFVVVVLFWLVFSALSALPFTLAEKVHMHFVDAAFEAVSGLTTTGATILSNLDNLSHSIRYYRAQLNFFGGMGIIVLAVALLPILGIGGMNLYKAETPGPMKNEKLTPRITETAKRLWYVYLVLNFACIFCFLIAGMPLFDAIAHGFSTLSLGGFSTHDANIGFYNNLMIELVAGIFSIIAAINFALFFSAWKQRSLLEIFRNPEFLFFISYMLLAISVVVISLITSGTFGLLESLVHGFFQTASIVTDNGLLTANYPNWPMHITLFLIMASFFGGCAGSACGGIKAIRFLLLFQQSTREIKQLLHPDGQFAVKIGDRAVPEGVMRSVWGFYFFYVFSFCAFSLIVAFTGVDLVTAFGSVAGCLNNMGVGLGETAINFKAVNDFAKWILIIAMLVGRLEVFPLLVIILRLWRG
jgi:trk system potassium uptake protein TrkH